MPDPHALGLFAAAAALLLLVPGPAVLYVVVQGAEHGRRAGLAAVAGLHAGTFVHTAAAAAGLSALVMSSAVAFSAVKYAGGAYLVYLGFRRLRGGNPVSRPRPDAAPLRALFLQGIVVNVLNPKTALFFLAFLPQFVDLGRSVWTQVVAFGVLFAARGVASDGFYALAAGWAGRWLRTHGRALRVASGSVLVGLGVAAALTRRTA